MKPETPPGGNPAVLPPDAPPDFPWTELSFLFSPVRHAANNLAMVLLMNLESAARVIPPTERGSRQIARALEAAEEYDRLMRGCLCHADELKAEGKLLMSQQLEPVPTARAVRVRDGKSRVTDGPFAETKELIAGYTLIEARSRDEALEWSRRFPNPNGAGVPAEIEVRSLYGLEDFARSPAIERFRALDLPG